MTKPRLIIHIALIIILGFVVYANSLGGKFVWDDYGLVKGNAYIKDWSNLPKLFSQGFGEGEGVTPKFYRPLQMFVHMADYSLFGLNVKGYHLTSVLLHILAAIALYFFATVLFNSQRLSLFASLLFVAHPVNTEAVSYISGVSDPLSLLFVLLCLACYIKSLHSGKRFLYVLALFNFVLALLAKENAVILPLLVLIYHYALRERLEVKKVMPFFVILAGYFISRAVVLGSSVILPVSFIDLMKRIPVFFAAIAAYLRLLLFPFGLRIEYGNRLFSFFSLQAVSGITITLLLVTAAFLRREKSGLVFFSAMWFFIALLPVSNIYPISDSFMMEHWLYLPAVGFYLILARLATGFFKSKLLRFLSVIAVATLIVFYSYLAIKQNGYWQNAVTLYKRTLGYVPDSWRFNNELGIEYADSARYEEAIASYTKALEINPDLIGVYNNLGNLYRRIGRPEEALSVLKRQEEARARLVQKYYAAGNAYWESGRGKEAVLSYKEALALAPDNLALYNALANVYITEGRYGRAEGVLKEALALAPDFALTHNNLAVAYYYEKRYGLALRHCDRAVELGYDVSPRFLKLLKPYRK